MLEHRRALTHADGEALRLYAILYDRHTRALASVESDGLLLTEVRFSSNGDPSPRKVKNPALLIAQESERQMIAILRDLGLTVLTRDKSKPTAPPEQKQRPSDSLPPEKRFTTIDSLEESNDEND